MDKEYVVRTMTRGEVDMAVDWAAKEGWNPGLHDAACFYATDRNGFFVGLLDGEPIAVGSAVCYDNQFAFCGFYIVSEAHRSHGYGLALTKERLNYVAHRNAGLDGVTDMVDRYARLGYQVAHQNARYQVQRLTLQSKLPQAIQVIDDPLLPLIADYDRLHFPAPRHAFLSAWLTQPQSLSLAWVDDRSIQGYGVIRACREGFKIGPLFADTPVIANHLFQALSDHAGGDNVYLDIPENNPEACALVNRYQMDKVFETARMYLKGEPNIKHDQVYGITTFELG